MGGTHDSGADKCDGELVCHETFPFGLGVITRLNTRCQRLGCELRAITAALLAYWPRTRRAMRSESEAFGAVLAPKRKCHHAGPHVRADGRTDGTTDNRDVGAALLLADGGFEPVAVLLGIGSHNGDGHSAIGHVVLTERLEDGLERLLAAAVDADQRQRAGKVVGELGLDVELCRELCRRGRNAAAGVARQSSRA